MDRLSNLPDEIGHRILEFVSATDINRLSVVSKSCQLLCLSTPFLLIDDLCLRNNPASRPHFMDHVDRLLSRRRIPHVVTFNWRKLGDEQQERRFLSWIHRATVCNNVRELRLFVDNLRAGSDLTLPSTSILSCTSLEILDLRFWRGGGGGTATLNILPSDLGRLSSLKSLTLYFMVVDQLFFDWISQCCKYLMSLVLDSTYGPDDITVSSSSLNDLSIFNIRTFVNLQVYAENLEVLNLALLADTDASYKAPVLTTPKRRILRQIMVNNLVEPDHIDLVEHDLINLVELRNLDDDNNVGDHHRRMNGAMHEFASSLVAMSVWGDTIEYMYEKRLFPIKMANLNKLRLHMNRTSNVDLVSLMAFLLKGTPNLKYLFTEFPYADEGDTKLVRHGAAELKRFSSPKLSLMQFEFPLGVQKSKFELINYFINSCEHINIVSSTTMPFDVFSEIKAYEKSSSSKATVHIICSDMHIPNNL